MEKKFIILLTVLQLGLLLCANAKRSKPPSQRQQIEYLATTCRSYSANVTDFGAVGDGVTLNTDAFNRAIANLSKLAGKDGALLFVPAGKWLIGSITLTSHFTLYLHKDAVLLASQKESDYPQIAALPSYGKGRDGQGLTRFASLIRGTNLTDVVITGANGTIEGQGEIWWEKFHSKKIKNTRPYLIEIMFSNGVQISNLTLNNSPSWNVHPVYSANLVIEQLTILAPVDSPNTDGINPDSCTNTRIRDCYIVSGDDCVAVKSGWDEYGISFGMPTQNLSISRLTCISPDSAMIALGSEMSGGIRNVRAKDLIALDTQSAVRIKTGVGRGGFVKGIYVKDMKLDTMKYVFWMNGDYGQHPDGKWNRTAFPVIDNINYRDVVANDVKLVGNLFGIEDHSFTGICISNVTATMAEKKKSGFDESDAKKEKDKKEKDKKEKISWKCGDIEGKTSRVSPKACELLPETEKDMDCDYPKDVLAIDKVVLKKCYV